MREPLSSSWRRADSAWVGTGWRSWRCAYEAWTQPGWERYQIPAQEYPRISPDFLAEERQILGESWYQQEYECGFIESHTQAFAREDVDRMFNDQVETWELLTPEETL